MSKKKPQSVPGHHQLRALSRAGKVSKGKPQIPSTPPAEPAERSERAQDAYEEARDVLDGMQTDNELTTAEVVGIFQELITDLELQVETLNAELADGDHEERDAAVLKARGEPVDDGEALQDDGFFNPSNREGV